MAANTVSVLLILALANSSFGETIPRPKIRGGNFNAPRPLITEGDSGSFSYQYPDIRRDPSVIDDYFGVKIPDPYRWLEDPDSEETRQFVIAQNNLTEPYLRKASGRDVIRKRFQSLTDYTKYGVPDRRGDCYFRFIKTGLQNHGVLYVQTGLDGEPRVLIDPNTLSEDGTVAISEIEPSESGAICAYGLSSKGSDWVKVYFKNVNTGQDYPDILEYTKGPGVQWTKDNKGIFYSAYPTPNGTADGSETTMNEHMKIYYHRLGTKQREDVVIVEFPEFPKRSVSAQISDDDKYLVISAQEGILNNLIYYIELKPLEDSNYTTKTPRLIPLLVKDDAKYQYVTSSSDSEIMYFHTNKDASNYQIIGIYLNQPEECYWAVLVPEHRKNVLNWAAVVNEDKLVVAYIRDVKSALEIRRLRDGSLLQEIDVGVSTVGSFGGRLKDDKFFFSLTNFLSPGKIFVVDMTKKQIVPELYKESVLEGFNDQDYVTKQVFYNSKDGTVVPMFIIHRKGLELDGKNPTLLYGYGGFDIALQPSFSEMRIAFIQLFNGVHAVANIRGGGEYGQRWHDGGRLLNKQNSFDDFQAAAEYLIGHKYTTASRLAIQGGSNGGLLMGACVNQRPELFGAAIAQVGVMDMLRFQKFTIGYAWTTDYGSSDNETDFHYLLKYSPLHNIRVPRDDRVQYPAVLVTTGDHDDRVVPLHSFKYIAELQYTVGRVSHQTNPLLISIETNAGHGGGKPTAKRIEENVDIFSFLIQTLNYKVAEPRCSCSW